ncbi:MAG: hypothetical protein AAF351_07740 [Pseudomonadota bacterium]
MRVWKTIDGVWMLVLVAAVLIWLIASWLEKRNTPSDGILATNTEERRIRTLRRLQFVSTTIALIALVAGTYASL